MARASGREFLRWRHRVNCLSCGFANATAARFCGGCGKRSRRSASVTPEAERRHLFVLFCDLVGSTPLSQRLDPETLRDVMGCLPACRRSRRVPARWLGGAI